MRIGKTWLRVWKKSKCPLMWWRVIPIRCIHTARLPALCGLPPKTSGFASTTPMNGMTFIHRSTVRNCWPSLTVISKAWTTDLKRRPACVIQCSTRAAPQSGWMCLLRTGRCRKLRLNVCIWPRTVGWRSLLRRMPRPCSTIRPPEASSSATFSQKMPTWWDTCVRSSGWRRPNLMIWMLR